MFYCLRFLFIVTVRCMISFEGLDSTALKLQHSVSFNRSYNGFVHSLFFFKCLGGVGRTSPTCSVRWGPSCANHHLWLMRLKRFAGHAIYLHLKQASK